MTDELAGKMSVEINDEQDRREAVDRGDVVWVLYNQSAHVWEVKFVGEPDWLNQLPDFTSMERADDLEKVNGIVGSRGLRPVGSKHWRKERNGWCILVKKV